MGLAERVVGQLGQLIEGDRNHRKQGSYLGVDEVYVGLSNRLDLALAPLVYLGLDSFHLSRHVVSYCRSFRLLIEAFLRLSQAFLIPRRSHRDHLFLVLRGPFADSLHGCLGEIKRLCRHEADIVHVYLPLARRQDIGLDRWGYFR